MKFLLAAFIPGALLALFLFPALPGMEINPLWSQPLPELIEAPVEKGDRAKHYRILFHDNHLLAVDFRGKVRRKVTVTDGRFEPSGNGRYYVRYEKTGTSLSFHDSSGERYWKMESREYPYLNSDGSLILLLNGDHSRLRIVDRNGNLTGMGEIHGRLATHISTPGARRGVAVGFLDGTYYRLKGTGELVCRGTVPGRKVIKTVYAAPGGKALVHYGGTERDGLMLDPCGEERRTAELESVQHTRTALKMLESGLVLFMDRESVRGFDARLRPLFNHPLERSEGHASFDGNRGMVTATWRNSRGEGEMLLMDEGGDLFFRHAFAGESFIDGSMSGPFIFLRGSDRLYCYSLSLPANP
jgi:hypothetical protein